MFESAGFGCYSTLGLFKCKGGFKGKVILVNKIKKMIKFYGNVIIRRQASRSHSEIKDPILRVCFDFQSNITVRCLFVLQRMWFNDV